MTIKSLALTTAACVVSAAAAFGQSQATQHCADRDMILDRLSSNYGETRKSLGLGANNALVEVFASDKTGTWTITVTMPDGQTCLVASGQSFESLVDDKLMIPGDDA